MADNQNQNATPAPSTVFMLDKNGNPGEVPTDKVSAAQAQGYVPATKMVDQTGQPGYVATDKVRAARQHNYAVTPDNPGVVKAVDYNSGQVNYILPHEVEDFHGAGQAIVQPDGSIRYPIIRDKNGVIAQDPLAEQQAHQKIYQALNADEKSRNTSYELKDAGKNLAKSSLYTAAGVTGSSALPALLEPTATGVLTAGGSEVMGPSLARQGMQWLGSQLPNAPGWLKGAGVGVGLEEGGRWLLNKLKH